MKLKRVFLTLMLLITCGNCLPIDPADKCQCVDIKDCPSLFHLASFFNSNHVLKYCDENKIKVCCSDLIEKEKSISEKKCINYTQINGFCPNSPLIRNGTEVVPHEYPFMISIQRQMADDPIINLHICGGSLINPEFILTAAHCFISDQVVPSGEISVVIGAHALNSSGIRYKVTIIIHPNYTSSDSYADLALLKLEHKVNISMPTIKPACLSRTGEGKSGNYTVAGWGLKDDNNLSNNLLKGKMIRADGLNCGDEEQEYNDDKQICARPEKPIGDVCNADSGGPLFTTYTGYDNCLTEIFGVVSGGSSCGTINSYTSYTRVSYYREWIESVAWPNEMKKV